MALSKWFQGEKGIERGEGGKKRVCYFIYMRSLFRSQWAFALLNRKCEHDHLCGHMTAMTVDAARDNAKAKCPKGMA